ncbi:MAG TPA: PIG-L family deacetylase [Vicinamibacterales bacterium]|jgi:LmbE family N-acetylglucosaminyl deacetylase|nr:PIG-L family deacetylase [Vicinamibacterales bacterium]
MRVRAAALSLLLLSAVPLFSLQPGADLETGRVGLGLALRRLAATGTFMMATAHPDDENNALLAMMSRGLGVRTVLATATRGDGGQNEIGPELFDALAALRTEELLAAHRFDGAEQFFTRAVDFGYSFSVGETFERWGREEILGDFVRLIRMTRPEVIVGLRPDGTGGGQHHQASAQLAREAFRAAADPARFPDQLRDGLQPWQAAKFYFMGPFGFRNEKPPDPSQKFVAIDLEKYDPLLGRTYAEIGSQARAMHKCQGFGQLLALPGRAAARYELVDTVIPGQLEKTETSLFDGIETRPNPAQEAVEGAQRAFDRSDEAGVSEALLAGLAKVRSLRAQSDGSRGNGDPGTPDTLTLKESQLEEALLLAHGVRIELLADDGIVVAGQPIKLNAIVAGRLDRAVEVSGLIFEGFEGGPACPGGKSAPGAVYTCTVEARIPADAKPTGVHWKRRTDADRYDLDPDVPFGAPFAPTPFRARVSLKMGGLDVSLDRPVVYRYEGSIFSGEKRMELKVVPAVGVSISPEIAILARGSSDLSRKAPSREIRVTATSGAGTIASTELALQMPDGWRADPPTARVSFSRQDEARTIRFTVRPPAGVTANDYRVGVTVDGKSATGFQAVEYPHIQRRHLLQAAAGVVKALDVRIAPNLRVGYIMGVGDQVPQAIEQLGATVEMIAADDLAWGDLSRFDVIVTGVRAYERRADLRANNHRLIEYARQGGVVLVQYNKFEFNEAAYAPLPAKVSGNRITDERAPVTVLDPSHPVFRFPNRIDERTWEGWVQERGLYFLGDRDPGYRDLVELTDPFEYNAGPKRGALVEAVVGRGRWIYVGLGLWRQLPAGTPGAYQLLANLLSFGKL